MLPTIIALIVLSLIALIVLSLLALWLFSPSSAERVARLIASELRPDCRLFQDYANFSLKSYLLDDIRSRIRSKRESGQDYSSREAIDAEIAELRQRLRSDYWDKFLNRVKGLVGLFAKVCSAELKYLNGPEFVEVLANEIADRKLKTEKELKEHRPAIAASIKSKLAPRVALLRQEDEERARQRQIRLEEEAKIREQRDREEEARRKVQEAEDRRRELERQRIEAQRQKELAEVRRVEQEKQRLAAEQYLREQEIERRARAEEQSIRLRLRNERLSVERPRRLAIRNSIELTYLDLANDVCDLFRRHDFVDLLRQKLDDDRPIEEVERIGNGFAALLKKKAARQRLQRVFAANQHPITKHYPAELFQEFLALNMDESLPLEEIEIAEVTMTEKLIALVEKERSGHSNREVMEAAQEIKDQSAKLDLLRNAVKNLDEGEASDLERIVKNAAAAKRRQAVDKIVKAELADESTELTRQ